MRQRVLRLTAVAAYMQVLREGRVRSALLCDPRAAPGRAPLSPLMYAGAIVCAQL